ncbi:MAG: hypothetical protein JWQ04_1476 [Pedosphaera sp.]|nr:hypothetical protein [Pedosphaera sp.]
MLNAFRRPFQQGLPQMYENLSKDIRQKLTLEQFLLYVESLQPETDKIFLTQHKVLTSKAQEFMHEKFGAGIGVLSLSEVKDNLLMWSHYALGHEGFVLEFDESNVFFGGRQTNSDEIWGLHKVRYTEERPQTVIADFDMRAILMTKGKPWEYEREWRSLRPFNQAAQKLETQPYPVYLFDLPAECIRSVIFGARMANEVREGILKSIFVNPAYAHLELFQTIIDTKKYALHFVPVVKELRNSPSLPHPSHLPKVIPE